MPTAQDPLNPLKSALSSLRSRMGGDKEKPRNWEENTGTLSGEDYPELTVRRPDEAASTVSAPAAVPAGGNPGVATEEVDHLLQNGELRALGIPEIRSLFDRLLAEGQLEHFMRCIEQIRMCLDSKVPGNRSWALDSVKALVSLEDLSLVPYGTLPLLMDCVGRLLVKEERPELRDGALDVTAHLLGIEAAKGDADSVHAHLAWLERSAGVRGQEYATAVLSSRILVLPALEVFFREGHRALDDKVLPVLRFAGEAGARTLMALLEEEQNRQRRHRILELLKHLGPASTPALKDGLVAGSWHLVRNALNLVAELEETQLFEYVVSCLDHKDSRVVHAAIRALWKTGGARAERYLLEALATADEATQIEILQGLSRIGGIGCLSFVAPLAIRGPESLRVQAIDTLGQVKHPAAVPLLEPLIKRKGLLFKSSEPAPVRVAVANALQGIGTQDARRILDQAFKDEPKGPVRDAFERAIRSQTR